MKRPTFTSRNLSVTDKYQTQRSYRTSTQAAGRSSHSNSQFCIPMANRFESLSVTDEQSTHIEEVNDKDQAPGYIHSKNKNGGFKST